MRRLFLLCLLFTLTGFAPGFPDDPPLAAPILAADVAESDYISLFDLTSGTRRDLTFGRTVHRVWDFTPDGCRVIFTLGNTRARLFSARLDGSDLRELVSFPGESWSVWDAHMQPNGRLIAFTLIEPESVSANAGIPRHRIALIDVNGGEPVFLSITGDEHTPRWSADGAWIIYVSYETSPTGSREADLWMVSADGVNKYRMTAFEAGSVSMPRPSPDGDLIGFVYSPSPNNDQVWMIGAQPDALPTQLTFQTALALELVWLPDSTALIAAARDVQGIAENRLWRIALAAGAAETQLAVDPALTYLDYPAFSAEGQWLAFRSAYSLYVTDAAQTGAVQALGNQANTPPVWSPGGFAGEATCAD
ncbi:MAG: PD40 domain-containing protein [Anaerolinea sp.]|nr:PD40 domain-containing protein [Anaerolinea sp.]